MHQHDSQIMRTWISKQAMHKELLSRTQWCSSGTLSGTCHYKEEAIMDFWRREYSKEKPKVSKRVRLLLDFNECLGELGARIRTFRVNERQLRLWDKRQSLVAQKNYLWDCGPELFQELAKSAREIRILDSEMSFSRQQ